jgi:general stress protein YciG
MARSSNNSSSNNDSMSVNEAGRRGGEATSKTHGREFYEEIGHKGGERVRELVEEGKKSEGDSSTSSSSSSSSRRND